MVIIKKVGKHFFNDNPQFATFVGDVTVRPTRISTGQDFVYRKSPFSKRDNKRGYHNASLSLLLSELDQQIYQGVRRYHSEVPSNRALQKYNDFAIGVELEMCAKNNDIANLLRQGDILSSNYFHFHEDGSLPFHIGAELNTIPLPASVVLSEEFWNKFCTMLKRYFKITSSCGLHFHLNRAFFFPDDLLDATSPTVALPTKDTKKHYNYLSYMALLYNNIQSKDSAKTNNATNFLSNLFGRHNNSYCSPLAPTRTMQNLLMLADVLTKTNTISSGKKTKLISEIFSGAQDFTVVKQPGNYRAGDNRFADPLPYFANNRSEFNFRVPDPGCLDSTVEFRRGKATLDPQKIHAMVCFIYLMSVFVRREVKSSTPIYDATTTETLDRFMATLRDQNLSPRLSVLAAKCHFGESGSRLRPWLAMPISPVAGKERL